MNLEQAELSNDGKTIALGYNIATLDNPGTIKNLTLVLEYDPLLGTYVEKTQVKIAVPEKYGFMGSEFLIAINWKTYNGF